MMKTAFLVFIVFVFSFSLKSFGQSSSNKGKDFYLAYSAHVDNLTSRMTLILSADVQTNYTVSIGNTVVATGSIAANTSKQEIINPNAFNVYISSSEVKETDKAIHVVTDKSISLYAIISNNSRTGGSMILPTNTLGKDYYAFSYQNFGGNSGSNTVYSQFTVLATKDGTEVEITPTQTSRSGNRLANTKFTIQLNKGDIYQYQSISDLTGSYVSSVGDCKPIAFFSGNTWTAFCEDGNSRSPSGGDNLYQQIFPINSWGKNFVTAPFYNTLHGNTDAFKIIVSEDNTIINVNGSTSNANGLPLTNPYAKGSVITFFSTAPNIVSGSKPIALAHYQTSQTCNLSNPTATGMNASIPFPGDPEITLLNPVEQTLNDITVFSNIRSLGVPTSINKYFINVIIKTIDIVTFKLDGANFNSSFVNIPGSEYSYAVIDVTNLQAQHRLTSDGGFSAIAYGYGNVESYAYLAGANIQSFTFQTSNLANQSITSSCSNEPFKLKINLSAPASEILWNLGGAYTKNQTNLTPIETSIGGKIYYTYTYPDDIIITTPGDNTFTVNVTYLNATNCGLTEEIEGNFTVKEAPKTEFTLDEKVCLGIEFMPIDKSTLADNQITKWKWDFDGTIITDQNPKFAFNTEGPHSVTLSVGTQDGCWSDPLKKTIMVYPIPVSEFSISNTTTCINTSVSFEDLSKINKEIYADAKIASWEWDFGDGTPKSIEQNPTHQYLSTGTKSVTLRTTSDMGCSSTSTIKTITITDLPTADFTTPAVCFDDGVAIFKNTSKNVNGTTNGLTYEWNFGEIGSSTNTSSDIDGKHTYLTAGDYLVTLKITNENGCQVIQQKLFTVNGQVEKADFSIQNQTNLCSNKDVIINNSSSAFFGKITKIIIYKDFVDEPEVFETIIYPTSDDIHLVYLPFGGSATKDYTIKLVAYSGETCFKETSKIVTLKPSPILEFADIPAACQNDGSVIINQAKETSGIAGSGIYSGDGVDADGNFNPKSVSIGSHVITYTFTAINGCAEVISRTINVYESPTADMGATLYILAGGQVKLPAFVTGSGLTYNWSPSLGLDSANVLNPIASPEKDTDYELTATTRDGCTVKVIYKVIVLQALVPPNSFTPNGDGVNDVWNIKYLESYPNATIEVFNRNGNRVFFSNAYKVPFDGNYQNEPLPVGVYYYVINPRNGRKSITGPLTIIR
ncbi:PKD domain-containing protein [Pedobacter jejuensis]|nr:PKD domain-containing protein [Pedobacter jejuensis]